MGGARARRDKTPDEAGVQEGSAAVGEARLRILCAAIPGPGHAYPMLAVARELAARGHDVVFASGTRHRDDAALARVAFAQLPPSAGSPLHDLRLYEDAAAAAEAVLPLIAAHTPEVVVHDLITLGPALAAEALGIPTATLVIHGLHTPSRDLPPFGWGEPPARTPLGRRRDDWMRRGKQRDLERARADLNRARSRLGMPPTDRLDGQLSPDLVLVATLPSLELPRSDWPRTAHVVGPCLWEPPGPTPAMPPGDAPLVLVAASTAHDHGALLRASLAAVARGALRAVVTAGAAAVPDALPSGVTAVAFASHGPILEHASLTVCNGGHGIVARSLSAGVPLVVVPGHGDQRENAYRVARAGAGVRIRRPRPRMLGRALARAMRRVLSDARISERARAIESEAAALDGPARCAELIEGLGNREGGKQRGAGQRPPPSRTEL